MSRDEEFRVRPGRIRSTRGRQARPFVTQVLASVQRAGGRVSRAGKISAGRRSSFGRGRAAAHAANRLLTSRSRGVVIKARVVRHAPRATPLAAHLRYLRREGVTRDGEDARLNADRWTQLDRQLQRDAGEDGVIALGRAPGETPDAFATVKLGRLRRLETMGLAHQVRPDRWRMDESAEATLREISERNDIIKRIHRGLTEQKIDRAASSWVIAAEDTTDPVIGRLVDRGLDDELRGTAYAVIDGIDGRTHHVRLPDLEAAGDGAVGSIVELRRFSDKQGRDRVALAVRSDVTLERQVTAEGASWLDRQAITREPLALASTGFGAEVKEAMKKRTDHLVEQGLASRDGGSIRYARNLIATLRQWELETLDRSLAGKSGMPFRRSGEGDPVAGTYRQRFNLASGRFAMIDDGLGFELVPWSPSLEKQRGREVSGIMRGDGGIDWSFARKRGLGL